MFVVIRGLCLSWSGLTLYGPKVSKLLENLTSTRWFWLGLPWLLVGIFVAVVLHFSGRLTAFPRTRVMLIAVGTFLGSLSLSPLIGYLITLAVQSTSQRFRGPSEQASNDRVILAIAVYTTVFLAWGVVLQEFFKGILTPPEKPAFDLREQARIDSFVIIESGRDLLELDETRFFESGLGGLLPGKRRKI